MRIPGLGLLVEDAELGWYQSEPVPVPVLGGEPRRFYVDGYVDDPAPEDFHAAIRTFLSLDRSALTAAAPSIFAYYRDITDDILAAGDDDWYVEIKGPDDVLDHIRLGDEPMVARDSPGDGHVYVSLECECDWEPEHGLQLVFRDGRTVTKVGPYDGHLTDPAAWTEGSPDGIVYHRPR
ncbi:hypothetical protein [Actinomadura sp. 7K507]|uniref:DUF6985 domain-containing protein n=1 Tax=Actinomadura sp. 7K507 TaxID=2530365 RepID=UPI00104A72CD|nr:hypothetical protein [Actinomadura sp. 7K507]TDC74028.1 hypothetical protein E1285_43875 [Actinomadura sp. 7K507]